MLPEGFWWNWGATAAGAIATFTAADVALFGQAFRDKFFPPILSLRLLDKNGVATEARILSPRDEYDNRESRRIPCRYWHLIVSNERRWAPASEVQVVLTRVREFGPDGRRQVIWTGTLPFQWANQQLYGTERTVGPDAEMDLCSVVKDKWLQFHALLTPYNLKLLYRDGPIDLLLDFQARAATASSQVLQVRVAWDGGWSDGADEMRRHLIVDVETSAEAAKQIEAPAL